MKFSNGSLFVLYLKRKSVKSSLYGLKPSLIVAKKIANVQDIRD